MKAAVKASVIFALFFPVPALALEITEIMYDTVGSDSGREWVEIVTDVPLSLADYTFFENGTNHRLTAVQGSSTLGAGEVAVIVSNAEKFKADFPNYAGTIFKSSFSLSNTGEGLAIKDAALTEVVSIEYEVSARVPAEGNSLHYRGGALAPGAPNPGSLAVTAAIMKEAAPKKAKTTSSSLKSGDTNNIEYVQVAAVDAHESRSPRNSALWTMLGLGALMVVGVSGALYVQQSKKAPDETTPLAEEFTLVDHA